jgi:intraflagellar transport protein 172
LVTQGSHQKAAATVAQYGSPPIQSNLDLYQRITVATLKDPESKPVDITNLRIMLQKLVYGNSITAKPKLLESFGKYLEVVYYMDMRNYCSSKKDLLYFASKEAISLLRYTKLIPVDVTFMEAGQAAKVQ